MTCFTLITACISYLSAFSVGRCLCFVGLCEPVAVRSSALGGSVAVDLHFDGCERMRTVRYVTWKWRRL
jgi:hypothetical protein